MSLGSIELFKLFWTVEDLPTYVYGARLLGRLSTFLKRLKPMISSERVLFETQGRFQANAFAGFITRRRVELGPFGLYIDKVSVPTALIYEQE